MRSIYEILQKKQFFFHYLFVLCYSTSYICDYKRNTFSIKTLNYE